MKNKITEQKLLIYSLVIIVASFFVFFIIGIFTNDKKVFEYTLVGLAAGSIIIAFRFFYKYEFDSDYIWVLILTAGILSVSYIHAYDTIFQNDLVNLNLFFISKMADYGVSLLQVVFLTVISVFVISAISEIKKATNTSAEVSNQNQKILSNINNTIEQTNIASRSAQDAARLAKNTVKIWESHNEITKILDEVENTYFGESFTSSLTKYLGSWKNTLTRFNDSSVSDSEKMIMAKLISNYIDEEITDFDKSTFASNFGLYAKNVKDIMDLFLNAEVENG